MPTVGDGGPRRLMAAGDELRAELAKRLDERARLIDEFREKLQGRRSIISRMQQMLLRHFNDASSLVPGERFIPSTRAWPAWVSAQRKGGGGSLYFSTPGETTILTAT